MGDSVSQAGIGHVDTCPGEPLDREYLHKNYLSLGCGDVLLDVFRIYLESAPLKLEQIRTLLDEARLDGLVGVAHGLKGEPGSVGGRDVLAAAAALEKAARAGDLEEALRLLPELEQQFQRLIATIEQELAA